jgi:hypothetical protein
MKNCKIRRVARLILIFALITSITIIVAYAEGNQTGVPVKIGSTVIYLDMTDIVQAAIWLFVAFISSVVLPLLKLIVGEKIVTAGVLAAEQLFGAGVGEKKFNYVMEWASKLIKLDEQTLRNFIEAAVRKLKEKALEKKND